MHPKKRILIKKTVLGKGSEEMESVFLGKGKDARGKLLCASFGMVFLLWFASGAFAENPSLKIIPPNLTSTQVPEFWVTQYSGSAGNFSAEISGISSGEYYDFNLFIPPCGAGIACQPYYSPVSVKGVQGISTNSGSCEYDSAMGAIRCRKVKADGEIISIGFSALNASDSGKTMQRENEIEKWRIDSNGFERVGWLFVLNNNKKFPQSVFPVSVLSPIAEISAPSSALSGSAAISANEKILNGFPSNPAGVNFFERPSGTTEWALIGSGTKSGFVWSANWNTNAVKNGAYEVYAYACAETVPANSCGASPIVLMEISNPVQAPADTAAPSFASGPDATAITDSKAAINWTTNENGNALVRYGTGTQYQNSASSAVYSKTQSVPLQNLAPETRYNFTAETCDVSLNCAASPSYGFMTKSAAASQQVTVQPPAQPPAAQNTAPRILSASASPQTALSGSIVEFSATASDAEGNALSYSWDFGDGKKSREQ
ncbi:MAG: PKD domain-containing protein, partial [archaeon]